MIELMVLFATGFGVGVIGALLGLGGGMLIIPVLVLGYGYPIHTAIACSLITMVGTSVTVAATNLRIGLANMPLGFSLELAATLGAVIGSTAGVAMPEKPLVIVFACTLVVIGWLMWEKPETSVEHDIPEDGKSRPGFYDGSYRDPMTGMQRSYTVKRVHGSFAASGLAGVLSGMLGIGGGVIKVPAMHLISGVPIKAAVATSNFMIGFTAATGAIVYLKAGHVNPVVTAMMVIGVIAGSKFAVRFLGKVADRKVRLIFIGFIVVVAVQMVLRAVSL